MSKKIWAHLALFTVNLLYGINYVVAKGLMPNIVKPNGFILMRVSGAVLLFWIVLINQFEKVNKKDFITLAFCGLFGVGINQLFFFNGLMRTSPLNASIIMTTTPIIVFVLSIFVLKEKPIYVKVIGIIIGAGGSIALSILSSGVSQFSSSEGDLYIFLNALSYSIYLVLVKPLMKKYKPLTVITWVFTFGLIYVLLWPYSIVEVKAINWQEMNIDTPWRIAFVVVGVTFLPYLLTVVAMKTVSPSVASSYIYFQPVLAGVFIFVFAWLGDNDYTADFSWLKVICALFIFIGVYLVSKPSKKNVSISG
ncbi:MAG TPA: DMT family transporter [Crocinitomix sp.]|nr:DMT family transporter [Crocinitomix sp.]